MQSPSQECNSHSSRHKFPRVLWSRKVRYRVQNSPSLGHIPRQIIPFYTLTYVLQINLNIILVSTPRYYKLSFYQISRPEFCKHFESLHMLAIFFVVLIRLETIG